MISVVMPAYNAEKFIGQAIESILNQTYREFELIIIDDGSTDNTWEIAKSYSEKDSRVRLIQSSHIGACNVRNLGVSESKYPWIAVMDADDIALPERLEKQIKATKENPHVVGWATYCYHINSHGDILSHSKWGITNEQEFYHARAEGHLPSYCHPTALLNKKIFSDVGGYRTEAYPAEDLDLFDRMSTYGPLLAIPEPLLCYRVHANSDSMQRFFRQKLITEYLVTCHRKRLAGAKQDLSFEEFLKEREQKPVWEKLKTYVQNLGMFYYRKSGLFYGEKQYFTAIIYLAFSSILSPQYSIGRAWNHVFSPKTRKKIQQAAKIS